MYDLMKYTFANLNTNLLKKSETRYIDLEVLEKKLQSCNFI